jgi:hypothetical protein
MRHKLLIVNTRLDEISDFLNRNAKQSLRDNKINIILENQTNQIYTLDMPSFGSTYQSSFRQVTDLKSVSHAVSIIEIDEEGIWGWVTILNTPIGKPINELDNYGMDPTSICVLKCIYSDLNRILTFDIDFIEKINVA